MSDPDRLAGLEAGNARPRFRLAEAGLGSDFAGPTIRSSRSCTGRATPWP